LFFEQDHGAVVMAALLGGIGAPHRPVLPAETKRFLAPERGGVFVDCTVGLGGHSETILEASAETRVIGIDVDEDALKHARERLARFGNRFVSVHANFHELARVLSELGETTPNGILADLGVSSLQLDTPERGFSFRFDAPLDMRMDQQSGAKTAADLLAQLSPEEIATILFDYGEERHSRRIAKRIVESREQGKPITTTKQLVELIERSVRTRKKDQIHPATRTFQALRIAVNRELDGLAEFLETAVDLLQPEGRLVVISFHSLEDRIVKRELRRLSGQCQCPPRIPVCSCGAKPAVELLTRRPVTATAAEIDQNPRARSAKLRASRKLISV
jgi:16S rRNA (cytosine1402-N4)-methyltransferase